MEWRCGSSDLVPVRPPSSCAAGGASSEDASNRQVIETLASLEQQLQTTLAETDATWEDFQVAGSCVRELQQAASKLGEGWIIRPFGSVSNGFGSHGSDLDVTCSWQGDMGADVYSAWELQERILPIIQANRNFRISKEVKSARVPILKLTFQQRLDVDLSFHNTEPLPNTQLLRAYVTLGARVRDLGMLVKLWAHAAGVSGAKDGCLSPYSFTLMAIYFMQVEQGVRLPCLPTSQFAGEDALPPAARVPWTCALPLSWLLLRFFTFFSSEFQWGAEVVSVRCGRRATADDAVYCQLRGRFSQRLHIEDPFLVGRNLHCVLRPEQETHLYAKLCEAAEALQQGHVPVGLSRAAPQTSWWLSPMEPSPRARAKAEKVAAASQATAAELTLAIQALSRRTAVQQQARLLAEGVDSGRQQ